MFLVGICHSLAVEIITPPQNAVVVPGSSLQLTCEIDQEYTDYIEWLAFIGSELGGKQIYRTPPFFTSDPRYRQFRDYGLEVDSIQWQDAGKYSVRFLTGDVRATANIVVIGQLKTCLFICFLQIDSYDSK